MNGVAERRNRTLKDMVRSMIARTTVPENLWEEALKNAAYILNRVPTKATTPFEIFVGRKPSLNHIRVWGCPAEARPYKPQEKKLDEKKQFVVILLGILNALGDINFTIQQNIWFTNREVRNFFRIMSL